MSESDEPKSKHRYCPLCGDALFVDGLEGFECRYLRQARAEGKPLPFDPDTGERQNETQAVNVN